MKSDGEDFFHKRKRAFIGREMASFSHGIRDPLSAIRESAVLHGDLLGHAEQCSGEELEQFAKILSTIENQVNILSRKSTYLDRFAQRMDKAFITLNPGEIVEEVVSFSSRFARMRQASLELKTIETVPVLYSDPLRIYFLVSIMIDDMLERLKRGGKILVLLDRADNEMLIEVQGHGILDDPGPLKGMDQYLPASQQAVDDLGGRLETSTIRSDIKRTSLFLPIKKVAGDT